MRYYALLIIVVVLLQGCASVQLNPHLGAKQISDSLQTVVQQYQQELMNSNRKIQQYKTDSLFHAQSLLRSQSEVSVLQTKLQRFSDDAPSQVGLLLDDIENRELTLRKWNDLIAERSSLIQDLAAQIQPLVDQASHQWIQMHTLPDAIEIIFTDTVMFRAGTAVIQSNIQPLLKSISEILRKQNYTSSEIIAFVDSQSKHIDQQSQDSWTIAAIRAAKLTDFLVDKANLPNNVVRPVSGGCTQPIASNEFPPGQSLNRRVIWKIQVLNEAFKTLLQP